MIHQQVNLYQDRFREKKLWVSARQSAAMLLSLLLLAAGWSYWLQVQLEAEQGLHQRLLAEQQGVNAELVAINAELAELLKDNRLDLELQAMGRQISARKNVLNFVEDNRFGSGHGFSAYLVALAQLDVEEIWLDEIRLADNFMRIRGSSLDADKIPVYFDRFSGESIFQGNRFNLFEIRRPPENDWKLDFEIATSGPSDEK